MASMGISRTRQNLGSAPGSGLMDLGTFRSHCLLGLPRGLTNRFKLQAGSGHVYSPIKSCVEALGLVQWTDYSVLRPCAGI